MRICVPASCRIVCCVLSLALPLTACGDADADLPAVYRALELHPGIWLPPVKELHFFDEKIDRPGGWFQNLQRTDSAGLRWRRQLRNERRRRQRSSHHDRAEELRREWVSRYFFDEPTIDWYSTLFPIDFDAAGEITPEYATVDERTISRAVESFPDLRVVYLVRNPIEREWSAALMATRGGSRGPESVLRQNRRHVRYIDNIDRWTSALKPRHFYLGFTDDLTSCPLGLLRDIVGFLGGDPEACHLPAGRPNSSGVESMPGEFASALATELQGEIDALAARYGGPAIAWNDRARSLAESAPPGDVEYPLDLPPPRSDIL